MELDTTNIEDSNSEGTSFEENKHFLGKELEKEIIVEELNIENNNVDKTLHNIIDVLGKFLNIKITKFMLKEVVDKGENKLGIVLIENEENKKLELNFVNSIFGRGGLLNNLRLKIYFLYELKRIKKNYF